MKAAHSECHAASRTDQNAYSFNALFITLKSSQEERIPLRMGVLNLVHELMHSFGAKHDPDPKKRPECTPEDKVSLINEIINQQKCVKSSPSYRKCQSMEEDLTDILKTCTNQA